VGARFHAGQQVHWAWGANTAEGRVAEVFARRVSRTLHGKRVVRNGTADNPAVLVEQDDGGRVLKRASELHSGGK
jgi:hypothetical protein